MDCGYNIYEVYPAGMIYYCIAENAISITSQDTAIIESISGTHISGKNNIDIDGILIRKKTVNYFPQRLEKIVKKLQVIWIQSSHLKQIHQSDLRAYGDLVYLDLDDNDIRELEQGLFDFNPKLKYISLSSNHISKVYPDIFDHLNELIYIILLYNNCLSKDARNNAEKVLKIIQEVKDKCPSPPSTTTSLPHITSIITASTEASDQFSSVTENFICSKTQSQLLALSEEVEALKVSKNFYCEKIENFNQSSTNFETKVLRKFQNIEDSYKAADERIYTKIQKHDQEFKSILTKIEQYAGYFEEVKSNIDQLKTEIIVKIDEKIESLESKLDKILKSLNNSN